MQRYNWDNTLNTRDLGYTPTADKSCVKPQRFIRSDAPLIVSDDVKEFLIRHDIRTVIDLRNEKIADMSPNAFVSDSRFTCCSYPLSINAKVSESENDVIENYCRMLENDAAIADIFGTMANAAGGIIECLSV